MPIDNETGEIITPFFRTGFNYDTDAASLANGLACPPEENQAQQQFKEEVDINTIVERFGLTGDLPENPRMPQSGDFTGITDFQSAMNMVREAEEAFMEFPAHIRSEFDNDPQKMMRFLENENNRARALEMGLIVKPPEKTRDMVDAVDELAAHFKSQSGVTITEKK
jgi:phage internal scaffolding protein